MGDRANVHVAGAYLYTHWGGHELPATLQKSLQRGRPRWDDPSYLARIIFCDMVDGDERDLTGFGISAELQDNEHPILEVDSKRGIVEVAGRKFTFEDYSALKVPVTWALLEGREEDE